MRFKQFLEETFILRKGDERFVYTGNLDPNASYNGLMTVYYHSQYGWLNAFLDNGTKITFLEMGRVDDFVPDGIDYADYADHYAPWLHNEVAAIHADVNYEDPHLPKTQLFFVPPRDLEKKTTTKEGLRQAQRNWINSLKESKTKNKDTPIVPVPGTQYIVWHEPPEVIDCMFVTRQPWKPTHGEKLDRDFFVDISNGEKITFKYKLTNADGEFAVIEWRGEEYYIIWWRFPIEITTPEIYREKQIKWMKSLREAKGNPAKYDHEQDLVIKGHPYFEELWGYQPSDAVPFEDGTKVRFLHYDFYNFGSGVERAAAIAQINGRIYRFKQEQFDLCTMTPSEYREWKTEWIKSLKESIELTSDALIKKMNDEYEKNGKYLNCRLAVQLTIEHSKLEELEKIKFKDIQVGDILSWGIRHYAIWLGDGNILQVGGWGEPVTVQPYREAKEYWDKPTQIYKNPKR